jgi:hypothetical protein
MLNKDHVPADFRRANGRTCRKCHAPHDGLHVRRIRFSLLRLEDHGLFFVLTLDPSQNSTFVLMRQVFMTLTIASKRTCVYPSGRHIQRSTNGMTLNSFNH